MEVFLKNFEITFNLLNIQNKLKKACKKCSRENSSNIKKKNIKIEKFHLWHQIARKNNSKQ